MEVVAVASIGNKTHQPFHGGQSCCAAKADYTRACLIVKYSAAAREYAKKRLHQFGAVEQERARTQTRTPVRQRGVVKKRKTLNPESSDGGAHFPTTGPNCLKHKSQQIHRNFMCWSSVSAVHLKMILSCIEKIAFSALNLKVLLEAGQREVPWEDIAAVRVRDRDG